MRVTVQYEAQARRAAGVGCESVELPDDCGVVDCIRQVADAHGAPLRPVLVDEDGSIQPTLLVFCNDHQVARDLDQPLSDGDCLTLLPPISGG